MKLTGLKQFLNIEDIHARKHFKEEQRKEIRNEQEYFYGL